MPEFVTLSRLQKHISLTPTFDDIERRKVQLTGYGHLLRDVVCAIKLVYPQHNPSFRWTAGGPCYLNRHAGWETEDAQAIGPVRCESSQRRHCCADILVPNNLLLKQEDLDNSGGGGRMGIVNIRCMIPHPENPRHLFRHRGRDRMDHWAQPHTSSSQLPVGCLARWRGEKEVGEPKRLRETIQKPWFGKREVTPPNTR